MGKIPLFHESDQEDEKESIEFTTNKGYAKHYDEFRKKEILGQLKNLESDAESSSSDDETTDEEVVDPDFDKEFFRTLAYLKRRDPAKYDEKPNFFENVKPVEEVALEKRKKKEKAMTLKDYERKVIVEKGGIYEDEEDGPRREERAESPSLVKQQEQLKDEIKRALNQIDTDDEADDEKGGLLKKRSRSKDDTDKEQADYLKWLADRKAKEAPSDDIKPLKPLKDFWSSKVLSKEDAFLRDYILNKRFVDSSGDVPTYEDIVATSEDEEELEKQEEYERQYNFRFEEPDSEFIKRYPRNVEESVRIDRNKRKEQRKALKERKQQEKEQKRRELEEIKAVKLQEIKDKIQKLKEIAATEKMTINEEELESDFDPEEHDRRMRKMFDDEYYDVDEGDQKPEFLDLDEELGIENYDREKIDAEEQEDGPYCEDEDFNMDADYDENQKSKKELQNELLKATGSKKKKGKRISKFVEVLRKDKPIFDPEDEKTYGEYIDEYYKLDYEDIIGDTPCRFRYVETVPNDFGLTIEEILTANTRELNRWASVKKTVQIRPKYAELNEANVYKRKGQNEELKKKILPSLYAQQDDSEPEEDNEITEKKQNKVTVFDDGEPVCDETLVAQAENKKKRKKKKKQSVADVASAEPTSNKKESSTVNDKQQHYLEKKSKKKPKQHDANEGDAVDDDHTGTNPSEVIRTDKKPKDLSKRKRPDDDKEEVLAPAFKKQKRFGKEQHKNDRKTKTSNVSESRLRAFGINPKKFHNKLKYGGKEKHGEGQNSQVNGEKSTGKPKQWRNQNGNFKKKNWKQKRS
ncbi:protein KRI1 homolog [Topomyia yanbarensis]|uniref:protein KRI1 homolog n=1 Tax=Topomyia yanbarensis TaxID=2498891 RepID=UPI00273C41D4|nr:protein KRI1 homolog [Topomyia yanbarensis]XP_058833205.1 protein KRI1 homolog [Topomyia yanbarensis]